MPKMPLSRGSRLPVVHEQRGLPFLVHTAPWRLGLCPHNECWAIPQYPLGHSPVVGQLPEAPGDSPALWGREEGGSCKLWLCFSPQAAGSHHVGAGPVAQTPAPGTWAMWAASEHLRGRNVRALCKAVRLKIMLSVIFNNVVVDEDSEVGVSSLGHFFLPLYRINTVNPGVFVWLGNAFQKYVNEVGIGVIKYFPIFSL